MKKLKIIAMIMTLFALCAAPALASGVSGRLNGNRLDVAWQVGTGVCELTVYQNDWPVCVRNVNGGSGSVSIAVGDASAHYRLRLRTAEGCYTADVKGEKPADPPVEAPQEMPRATQETKPTGVPSVESTEVAISTPTQVPSSVPTEVVPAEMPSVKPTTSPTQRPTSVPTKAPVSVVNRDDLATQVLNLVNEERASRGLGTLRMDSELNRAACVRAGEIAQSFSHTRPDGSSWSTVSASAYGENIAMGQQTAEKVVAAWMTSTGHRENILRESYGTIGICAYKVNGVMYWVQLFGR